MKLKSILLTAVATVGLTAATMAQNAGSFDSSFQTSPGASGVVNKILQQPDGKIVVGGNFSSFISTGGTAGSRITRLLSDGSVDSDFISGLMGPGFNGAVIDMALLSDGKILVVGEFTNYFGQICRRVAKLSDDSMLDDAFDIGFGANDVVNSVSVQPDGKIILAGRFTEFNELPYVRIVRLNSDGSIDKSFNPGSGTNFEILSTAIMPDGKIMIGGIFMTYNGFTTWGLARLNSNGSLDTSFNSFLTTNVTQIYPNADGTIYVAGTASAGNLMKLDSQGNIDPSFEPGEGSGGVRSFVVQPDGKLVVVGTFASFNNFPSSAHIVRLNPDGTNDLSFDAGEGPSNYLVASCLQSDGKIIVGGAFTSFDGNQAGRIARLNNDFGGSVSIENAEYQIQSFSVYPNPASTHITIDYSNFNAMSGYTLTAVNSIGQTVFTTSINQQTSYIDLSTWTGNGIYVVQLLDAQNNIIENRKILIK